jgi:C4-dicarboxylate-specific signal transduction histidine kinase
MRYSLGFILALSLAGLQFLAITTVVSMSYVSSQRAMLEHARGLMEDAGLNAAENTKRFLEPAGEIADPASRILNSGLVSTQDPEAMERYFFQLLRADAQLSGMTYGDTAGNFIYVMKSDGPGPYRTKFITHDQGQRRVDFIWRADNYAIVAQSEDPNDNFDARTRPWYIAASTQGGRIWTDPYIFFSSQQPGVTVAAPVMDDAGQIQGVVGIDLDIADISLFLSDLTIGETGAAFILSDDGHVIAHPDPARIKMQNDDGTLGFIGINDFSDPIVRAAFAGINATNTPSESAVESQFAFYGDKYMTLLLPIPGIDLPWNIAVFAPENDFVQGIKNNRTRNIWIAAIISLVTAIAGLTLAELILKPVRAFAVRTALVSQGEVSIDAPLPRTYKELSTANKTLIDEIAQRRSSDAKAQDLSRELSHFSRVNVMGQMATGLAHELSQPLTAITQNLDTALSVAKLDPNPNHELISILTELDEQAHQGGDIIRALRGFVRKDKALPVPFDFHELVSQACRLIQHELDNRGVTIDARIDELPLAIGHRVEFAQVLINLMRNAVDAMDAADSKVKKITITAKQAAGKIEVWVSDTGPGVDPNVTLFKEFQTSKPDGLGLGLSISRTIVESNAGRLWYAPTDDAASRFCFTVPCETP